MRRKIEITHDGQSYTDSASDSDLTADQNENAPEFADHAHAERDNAASADSTTSVDGAANRAGVSGTEAAITALQAEVDDLRLRAEEAEKRLMYANAEFQNISRRKDEQYQANLKHATSDFIKNLLPVLDNFERALKAAEQTRNYDALVGGVNGTLKQMVSALQKAGVTPIEAVGKEFDPNYHEAIGHAESSEHPANTVAEEVQRGYLMHDRVLRPTLVKVSQG
jgi:molecular chaperone GrpE